MTEAGYDVHFAGPLMAKRAKMDTLNRGVNGLLKHPPVVYVNTPHGKYGLPWSYEIDWDAAWILAPEHMAKISESISTVRSIEEKVRAENFKASMFPTKLVNVRNTNNQ